MIQNNIKLVSLTERISLNHIRRAYCMQNVDQDGEDHKSDEKEENKFRVLNLRKYPPPVMGPVKKEMRTHTVATEMLPSRSTRMPIDQDWSNVWPAARSFHPATVPLPVRQGYVKPNKGRIIPGKYANTELMKIPNFLHLTPPAIKKHCNALKAFCTPWPSELQTDEDCDKHFPVEIITSDYLHSSPSIRDARARIVSLTIKLSSFFFDAHAKDKFKRLVDNRYNEKTDQLTIVADRCPMRVQNYDYLKYLLNVLYTESWKIESWESEKTEDDDERFFWNRSSHRKRILELVKRLKEINANEGYVSELPENASDEEISSNEIVNEYGLRLTKIMDDGDSVELLDDYKKSVKKLLRISV